MVFLKQWISKSIMKNLIDYILILENIIPEKLCEDILNEYEKVNPEFENKSIIEMALIIQNSIDFLNYLDELIYPSIGFKNIFKKNIENLEVQNEFDLVNNSISSKFYNLFSL